MRPALVALLVVLSACTSAEGTPTPTPTPATSTSSTTTSSTTSTTTTSTTTTTTTTLPATDLVDGEVIAADGTPIPGASIASSVATATANDDGYFTAEMAFGTDTFEVSAFGWASRTIEYTKGNETPTLDVVLEPVRALRVSRYVAMDAELWQGHLQMAADTTVNAMIFDTKDESGQVLYDTAVEYPHTIGAVNVIYDPTELIAEAKEHGLYTVTRIVSFEDPARVKADPDTRLRGNWVDMTDPEIRASPLALAVEACAPGSAEIPFD